jgi:hypothetical protein
MLDGALYQRCETASCSLPAKRCQNFALLSSIERKNRTLVQIEGECIRPERLCRWTMAGVLVEGYVEHCNNVCLNTAIGYIMPKDVLAGCQQEIHAERDQKLEEARKQRRGRQAHIIVGRSGP